MPEAWVHPLSVMIMVVQVMEMMIGILGDRFDDDSLGTGEDDGNLVGTASAP